VNIPAKPFQSIVIARGLDLATLANRSGVPTTSLDDVLEGKGNLTDAEVEALAAELAVPVQALFARQTLNLSQTLDFRTSQPSLGRFEKGTLQAISFVEKLSSTFTQLGIVIDPDPSLAPVASGFTTTEAIRLAKLWRSKWGLSFAKQLEWQDSNKVYVSLRSFIEGLGVLVLHRTFDTDEAAGIYAQVDNGPHTIIINTTSSSKARKLFTLAHEFCHVLLRQEGASNPSVLRNQVERFCNKFAAYLLAPDVLIKGGLERFNYTPSSDPDFVRLFAKKLGISQEALVLRLVESNYLDKSDYARWRSRFNGPTPPGDLSDGRSGGRSDPLVTKRTTYGSLLLNLLGQARSRGQLDEIDIYRLCGLKPKYQNRLFGVV
jgi:Zn-dependent peptidase ImmA (M78 family)